MQSEVRVVIRLRDGTCKEGQVISRDFDGYEEVTIRLDTGQIVTFPRSQFERLVEHGKRKNED